jgi:hypothetical protein
MKPTLKKFECWLRYLWFSFKIKWYESEERLLTEKITKLERLQAACI